MEQRRIALGLSMEQLAALVGVKSWQTVQQWEKAGGTAPNRGRIERVAQVLETSVEWLQSGKESLGQTVIAFPASKLLDVEHQLARDIIRMVSVFTAADTLGRDTVRNVIDAVENSNAMIAPIPKGDEA